MAETSDPLADFITAACVPLDSGHASGTLDRAEAILAAHPGVATRDIHAAAILGDDTTVRRHIAANPASATAKGGPHGWDALTHLCFSKYLRLDRARSSGFVRTAEALLDADASPKTGFYSKGYQPEPEFECVLYGAAGVAHHPELTRLLLERGADPNDDEVVYHTPEGWDNAALEILVQTGKLTADSLATLLLRKTDWHDCDGIRWLLEHGVDPNRTTRWGKTALQNAALRDNAIETFEVLMDHGANPTLPSGHVDVARFAAGKSALSLAARRGRGDVLNLFERRGVSMDLQGVERLIAACARNNGQAARSIAEQEPRLVSELRAQGGRLLAEFSGNGNTDGVRHLLDLGVDVRAWYDEGDGYFEIATRSTALHVAAWRARPATVQLLIERGAPIHAIDGNGRTPLVLAVRACVDSYWKDRRSPESVLSLLRAGSSLSGVSFPCGYSAVDELLKSHGAAR